MTTGAASRRRRAALLLAVGLLLGLPVAAALAGPVTSAAVGAALVSAGPPGSQLAGMNTSATATGIQIAPLTPGIVGAGNVVQGNLVEASIPYASSTVSTGPSMSGLASPAYPGPTAAAAGTAIQTFAPTFPAALANLLNDPVLAQSAYPPQFHTGTSGSFQPAGASLLGVGTAHTESSPGGTAATSSVSDTSSLGSLLAGAPAVGVASAATSTNATLAAASVGTEAHTVMSGVNIGGVIRISGITSDASASSNGTTAQETSSLHIGSVTVAGLAASIGPNGISLNNTGLLGQLGLVAVANQALQALQQAGLTVKTIAPTSQQSGQSASVTSGALQISFIDANIPNPQGRLPIGSSIGLKVDLGLSQASANATALPPFVSVPGSVTPPVSPVPVPSATGTPAGVTGAVSVPSGSTAVAPGPQLGAAPVGKPGRRRRTPRDRGRCRSSPASWAFPCEWPGSSPPSCCRSWRPDPCWPMPIGSCSVGGHRDHIPVRRR